MKKKLIFIIIPIIILVIFLILFTKYKNLIINIDIIEPGVATIIDDPVNGRSINLYEEEYTTIDINIKNFFNVKTYPIIGDENVIYFDEKNNQIIAKNVGETTIYFQTLFGLSKSNKLRVIVDDKEIKEYSDKVKKSEKEDSMISTNISNNKLMKVEFINNNLGKANEIYLDDQIIEIDNFILDGRTYIDIYDYCEKINCSIERNNNTLLITKNISDSSFVINHEINTDTFRTTIEIGNQKLDYDIGSKYIDVKSCPKDGWECDENNVYVPLRFLMQAFGYTVSWNQEYRTVAINNYLYDTFGANNKIMIADSLKYPGDVIENNAFFAEDKQLYLYVTNKDNKVLEYQIVLAFSSTDVENGKNTDSIFEVNGNNIKLLDRDNILNSKLKTLIIQDICDENNKSDCGTYPIVLDYSINEENVVTNTGEIEEGDKSKGYSSIYNTRGLSFIEYKQTLEPYRSVKYWGGTISGWGCGPVSVSILCSAYDQTITPTTIANYMNQKFGNTGPNQLNKTLINYGFNTQIVYYNQGDNEKKKQLQEHLLNGGTIIMSVCTPKAGGNCSKAPSYDYANERHIIAVLDIDSNNLDNIYISNPNTQKKTGWQSLDYILKHVRGNMGSGNSGYYILTSR